LIVNKPAGLLSQGDHSRDETVVDLVAAYLKQKFDKPGNVYVGLVHRLDRNVSGVMLVARTSKAASRLSDQFRRKAVQKTYLAVAEGLPADSGGDLVSWLATAGDHQGVTQADIRAFDGAKESRLRYTVLTHRDGFSQVSVQPITGRPHQIRAQMALLGHPLLGDVKYGSLWRLGDHRLALHASRLEFAHPVGGQKMVFDAPLPEDWPWPNPAQKVSKRS